MAGAGGCPAAGWCVHVTNVTGGYGGGQRRRPPRPRLLQQPTDRCDLRTRAFPYMAAGRPRWPACRASCSHRLRGRAGLGDPLAGGVRGVPLGALLEAGRGHRPAPLRRGGAARPAPGEAPRDRRASTPTLRATRWRRTWPGWPRSTSRTSSARMPSSGAQARGLAGAAGRVPHGRRPAPRGRGRHPGGGGAARARHQRPLLVRRPARSVGLGWVPAESATDGQVVQVPVNGRLATARLVSGPSTTPKARACVAERR